MKKTLNTVGVSLLAIIAILIPCALHATTKAKTAVTQPYSHLAIVWTDLPKPIDDNIHSSMQNLVSKLNENKTKLPQAQLNKLIAKSIRQAMSPYGYFSPRVKIHD